MARASRNLVTGTIDQGISPKGLDLQVVISPFQALTGGVLMLTVPSCTPCSRCGGAGKQGRFPCALCDGEGLLRQTEEVRLGVPANAGDVTQIKVPLRGLGPHNFYLSVRVRVAWSIEGSKNFRRRFIGEHMPKAIGIDLGTTNSVVAVIEGESLR